MFKKILVATDGSKTSQKAVKYAVELAKQSGASIVLFSVIDKSSFTPILIPPAATSNHLIESVEDYLSQAIEAHIIETEKLCKKNEVQSRKVIRKGHPVEEIIKEAKKSKVDLIVLGSHGKSALKATLLGSVTFGVIHKDTKFPVLVVKR